MEKEKFFFLQSKRERKIFFLSYFFLRPFSSANEQKRNKRIPNPVTSNHHREGEAENTLFLGVFLISFLTNKKLGPLQEKVISLSSLSLSLSLSCSTRRTQKKGVNDSLVHAGQRDLKKQKVRGRIQTEK